MINSHNLTQSQIDSIKQTISALDGRFTFDVSDQEVWDYVNDKTEVREFEFPHFQEAALYCYDDWGVCVALGFF